MKKVGKRIASAICALAMCAAMVPATVLATTPEEDAAASVPDTQEIDWDVASEQITSEKGIFTVDYYPGASDLVESSKTQLTVKAVDEEGNPIDSTQTVTAYRIGSTMTISIVDASYQLVSVAGGEGVSVHLWWPNDWYMDEKGGSFTWSADQGDSVITITLKGGKPETPAVGAPTDEEVKALFENNILVQCSTLPDKHTAVSMSLLGQNGVSFEDGGYLIHWDESNPTVATLEITQASLYAQEFDKLYSGSKHYPDLDESSVEIALSYVENEGWAIAFGEQAKIVLTCDGSGEQPGSDEPEKPTEDEVKDLFGESAVQVNCVNENATHDTPSKTYALQDGTFDIGNVSKVNNGYTVTVTVGKIQYVDYYQQDVGVKHTLQSATETGSTVITLIYDEDSKEWTLPNGAVPIVINVTCDTTTDPGTDKPDEPTVEEISDAFENRILVLCDQKNPNHYRGLRGAYYWLNQGNFSFTEVRQDADNGYYVEVTVEPGRYVELFSQATGVNHTLVSGQGNQTFRMYYTKGVWTPDVQQVTFNVTCSWTTVSGGDTPKDEHPEVGEAIANGTWGTPTPAASATSTIPQTSDSMPIGLLAGTAAIAAAAIALLLVLRKRRQQ